MASHRGQLLLILASRDLQTAAQIAAASPLSPTETALQLRHLVDQGFVVASDGAESRRGHPPMARPSWPM
jgi:predicted ArsR family transcriptional regulator